MSHLAELSLSTRIIVINGAIFGIGTALLAFSPATVSATPLVSEVVVLLVGLGVMVLANGLLVRGTLRPLERLVDDLDRTRAEGVSERLPVRSPALARGLATAVNDLLDRVDETQRGSNVAALAAQEAERARIAQELHDGVGQSLTAILLDLRVLSGEVPAENAGTVDRIREATRASLDEVRAVARTLRPHVLEDLGLRSALAALTTDLFGSGETHVRRGVTPGFPDLDEAVELVVFRVAQEALTNVARHARAGTVDLQLGLLGDAVQLSVSDDGVGIPEGATGTGLRGMRERATLVGGTLDVRRQDGGGTQVTLVVPGVVR